MLGIFDRLVVGIFWYDCMFVLYLMVLMVVGFDWIGLCMFVGGWFMVLWVLGLMLVFVMFMVSGSVVFVVLLV